MSKDQKVLCVIGIIAIIALSVVLIFMIAELVSNPYEPPEYSYSTSYKPSSGSSTSRKCYICNESGASHKYGSYYYCAYCYAMVKTVHENQ